MIPKKKMDSTFKCDYCQKYLCFSWKGRVHWGLTMNDGSRFASGHLKNITSCANELSESTSKVNLSPKSRNTKRAVSSLTESALLVDILKNEGYEVIEAAGAGYKILAVIQGINFEYPID